MGQGGGSTFHCLFSSSICSSAFTVEGKTQKLENPLQTFLVPVRDQRPCRYTANISIHPLSKLDLKTFLKTSFKTGVKVREGVNLKKTVIFKTLS